MKLYHGTSETSARQILGHGLKPRTVHGNSTWEEFPSNPSLVYLTEVYAPYFAFASAEDCDRWVVLEIEADNLDPSRFLPDEDFLEQVLGRPNTRSSLEKWANDRNIEIYDEGIDIQTRTRWFSDNVREFADIWDESIRGLGNCAYDGMIAPQLIERAVAFQSEDNIGIAMTAMDPSISTTNYMLMNDKYRALTEWFFNPIDPCRIIPMLSDNYCGHLSHQDKQQIRKIWSDRSALEVLR